jgi:hypothetical protein
MTAVLEEMLIKTDLFNLHDTQPVAAITPTGKDASVGIKHFLILERTPSLLNLMRKESKTNINKLKSIVPYPLIAFMKLDFPTPEFPVTPILIFISFQPISVAFIIACAPATPVSLQSDVSPLETLHSYVKCL